MSIGLTNTVEERPRLAVRDPARGSVIDELLIDDPQAVAVAAERARAAQPAWAALSVRDRARLLKGARREMVRARAVRSSTASNGRPGLLFGW